MTRFLLIDIVLLIIIGQGYAQANNGDLPEDIKVLYAQPADHSALVMIIAVYNDTLPIFNITSTNVRDANLIINVSSMASGEKTDNLTTKTAYTTLSNLSYGYYNISVLHEFSGLEIANETCSIVPIGQVFSQEGITATIGTFKGGLESGTLYLMPFPSVPVCLPAIFNWTSLWANSTEKFYLIFNLSNAASALRRAAKGR